MERGDVKSLQVGVLAGITIAMLAAVSRPQPTGGFLPKPDPVVIQMTIEEVRVMQEPIVGTDPEPIIVRTREADVCHSYLEYLERVADTDQIETEIWMEEMKLVAQLVRAEAGNQSFDGKRRVAAVVFNRLEDPDFPDTIEGVIYQENQFSVIRNGAFKKAAYTMTDEDLLAAIEEWDHRSDDEILYFTAGRYGRYGTPAYQLGDHFFCKR